MTPSSKARWRLRRRLKGLFGAIRTKLSPNRSPRYGAKVRAGVLHTTESSDTSFDGIVNYFLSDSSDVSSHYVIDALPQPGKQFTRVIRMVPEHEKAWTARSANPVTINYELIGRASRNRADWLTKYRAQIRTAAALVAEDSLQYGFPPIHDFPGILGHRDLTREGFPNDHTDPGPDFPYDVFLRDVKLFRQMGAALGVEVVPPEPGVVDLTAEPIPARCAVA